MVPFKRTVSRTFSFLTTSSVNGVFRVYVAIAISFSFRIQEPEVRIQKKELDSGF
jgi:hypothetical protein